MIISMDSHKHIAEDILFSLCFKRNRTPSVYIMHMLFDYTFQFFHEKDAPTPILLCKMQSYCHLEMDSTLSAKEHIANEKKNI